MLKHKGKYVFLGLSGSGKSTLIKYMLEEGKIDPMPFPNAIQNFEYANSGK